MLSYRVMLDVPFQLAAFVSGLLAGHRRELGTRAGTRALTCWKQAVFALAWFRDRPDIRRLGAGFGISQATAYRYKDEAVEVLAAKAPSLREALDRAPGVGVTVDQDVRQPAGLCFGKSLSGTVGELAQDRVVRSPAGHDGLHLLDESLAAGVWHAVS